MPKVTFIQANGTERLVEVPCGTSLMTAAVQNNVHGIDADCGGAMSCATCHVHVAAQWIEAVGVAEGTELDLLDFADGFEASASRLSCQIVMRDELDGVVLSVPGN